MSELTMSNSLARPSTDPRGHQGSPAALRRVVALALAAGILAAIPAVAAADDEERIASFAVQNRRFNLGSEFAATVGVLPLDAFTKGLTVGGGYTHHFTPLWAWEVVQVSYSFGINTGLKNELLENFEVEPTQLDELQAFASSNVVFKPLYGKFAWLNDSVVHAEVYLLGGGGAGKYEYGSYRAALDAGAGLRVYLSPHSSMRLDVREYAFFPGLAAPENELHVSLSLAVSAGGE